MVGEGPPLLLSQGSDLVKAGFGVVPEHVGRIGVVRTGCLRDHTLSADVFADQVNRFVGQFGTVGLFRNHAGDLDRFFGLADQMLQIVDGARRIDAR